MKNLSKAYTQTPGLLIILLFGLFVEGANFQNTFYKFMMTYRPDWGPVNHFTALLLALFLLFNIVEWGMRGNKELSWGFALITMVISFSVYSRIELAWNFTELTEMHLVVLILSIVLPAVVAHTTHTIQKEVSKQQQKQEAKRAVANPQPVTRSLFEVQGKPLNGQPYDLSDTLKKK